MTNKGVFKLPNGGGEYPVLLPFIVYEKKLTNNDIFNFPVPQWGVDLELRVRLRSTVSATSDEGRIYFNNDFTDANYSNLLLTITPTGSTSSRADNAYGIFMPGATAEAAQYKFATLKIHNYSLQSTPYKVLNGFGGERRGGSPAEVIEMRSMFYERPNPITTVRISTDNNPTDLLAAGSYIMALVYGRGIPKAIQR